MFTLGRIAELVGGILHTTSSDDLRRSPTRVCHDSRRIRSGDLFVALPGARTHGRLYVDAAFASGACAAMLSLSPETISGEAGFRGPWIEVRDASRALLCLAEAWRKELGAKVVAVSGTNGKTTTKALLAHLLDGIGLTYASPGNLNTEIGVPISVLYAPKDAKYAVFEAAADRPGDLALISRMLRPDLVVVTGAGRGHLDRFSTVDGVAEEKWQLVETRPRGALAIVNGDDDRLWERSRAAGVRNVLTFGICRVGCDLLGDVVSTTPQLVVHIRIRNRDLRFECPLLGAHNALNLLAAVAAARSLGVPENLMMERAASFRPPPHRLALRSGLSWGSLLDDSYNANPDSMGAALRVLGELTSHPSERTVVFGEMQGLGSFATEAHRRIAEQIASLGVSAVFCFGRLAIDAAASQSGLKCLPTALNADKLIAALRAHMKRHPGVLLVKGSHALGLDRLADALAGDVESEPTSAGDPG
ncbi:UDP-N-acetylmuramoyl-tripeptide--D-alanyl-D-alanine ligase [Candidatus Bipolaricaulota bacterium]|nr:UDP-N-acetylmuramoyl-tripeptide--D-alanyl-D-alanine ligase [Candidatus Bipolaricaulota bacterium]